MAEKSLENEAGVSAADGGADDDEGAAVDALGAAVVGVAVLLLLLHAASNNPPAASAAIAMVRLDANCPPWAGHTSSARSRSARHRPTWSMGGSARALADPNPLLLTSG
jgi:hypothetical protein